MKVKDILLKNVKDKNDKKLEQLKNRLTAEENNEEKDSGQRKKTEWMLCLGAGVSISVGLPNWYKLLATVTAQLLPTSERSSPIEEFDKDVKEFYDKYGYNDLEFIRKWEKALQGEYEDVFHEINLLEAGEYIRIYLKKDLGGSKEENQGEEFEKRVNYTLNRYIGEACKFDKEITEESLKDTTLLAVARLMKTENDALIHNAITYNYDNLLEASLRRICKCPEERVHSIIKEHKLPGLAGANDWNIYHVHGRIPAVDEEKEPMSAKVILAESDYYEEEQVNYSWTNVLQSYGMLRTNMIFLGFSGADYNFRRLVKHIEKEKRDRQQYYIFFSVDGIVKSVFSKYLKKFSLDQCIEDMKNGRKYAYEQLFINYLIDIQTTYWNNHGFQVIWSSHEQLSCDLERLHEKPELIQQ